jgi:hypothetical protein
MAKIANIRETLVNAFGADAARTGKKGRPVSRSMTAFANNYLATLAATQEKIVHKNPKAIAVLLDTLVSERIELSQDALGRLADTKDAQVMGMLLDEPCQVVVNTRILVSRRNAKETLGRAFARRMNHISNVAQEAANESGRTVYAVVTRYAICRDARTKADAIRAGIDDLAFVPSQNTLAVIITDDILTSYKGYLAIAGEWSPVVAKTKRAKAPAKALRSLSKAR